MNGLTWILPSSSRIPNWICSRKTGSNGPPNLVIFTWPTLAESGIPGQSLKQTPSRSGSISFSSPPPISTKSSNGPAPQPAWTRWSCTTIPAARYARASAAWSGSLWPLKAWPKPLSRSAAISGIICCARTPNYCAASTGPRATISTSSSPATCWPCCGLNVTRSAAGEAPPPRQASKKFYLPGD